MIITNPHKYLNYEVPKQVCNKVSLSSTSFSKCRDNWSQVLKYIEYYFPPETFSIQLNLMFLPSQSPCLPLQLWPPLPGSFPCLLPARNVYHQCYNGGYGCIFFSLLGCELLGAKTKAWPFLYLSVVYILLLNKPPKCCSLLASVLWLRWSNS